ncbi:hypothetical protein HY636_03420 [Candidatus Woesearchaeota archaeon]|nr:hypothetical protein [Candidatus Woesearchaeota archaeon]
MEKRTIMAIVLGLLVVVSLVQAFQLNGLKNKITDSQLKMSSNSGSTSTSVASGDGSKKTAALPSNIKELPQMVGGC